VTIEDFIKARLREEEEAVRYALEEHAAPYTEEEGFTLTWDWALHTKHTSGGRGTSFVRMEDFDPERLLLDITAKKLMVATLQTEIEIDGVDPAVYAFLLRLMASPWMDHPDFEEGWRA